jgi:hypothetical protein
MNKISYSIIIIFIIAINCCLAVTLNQPESIFYDEANDLYIISNTGSQGAADGKILSIDKEGNIGVVIESGLNDPRGMVLIDGMIYVADVNSIAIVDYKGKSLIITINISSSMLLNDICYDGDNYLYITDTQLSLIYRLNIKTEEVIKLNPHGQIDKPNGIIYEKEQNRLIFVSFREKSPIQAIDLQTLNVSVLKQTEFDYLDGIAKDREGNYFISSWGNTNPNQGKIYKYKSDFSGDLVAQSDLSGPADIFFNPLTDTLAIPNMTTNSISYTWLPTKPSSPKPIFPENDAKGLGQDITFSWTRGLGAARYYIRLATNPNFDPYLREDTIWYRTSGEVKGLEKNTKYYYKIRCCNLIQKSNWSEIRTFTTVGITIQAPNLLSPDDNAINVSLTPIFIWTNTGAKTYNMQLSLDKNFTDPIKIKINEIEDTTFLMPGTLANNKKYYWRVNSIINQDTSIWSDIKSFTTEGIAATPILISPQDNSTGIPLKPLFKWEQSDMSGTSSYHLIISKDENFEQIAYSILINANQFDTTLQSELEADTKYYWRVAALSIQDSIPNFSDTWSFNTLNPSDINSITLNNPIISVFPNPTSEDLNIEIKIDNPSNVSITIYNELGNYTKQLSKGLVGDKSIRFPIKTSEFTDGIYFLKILIDNRLFYYKLNIIH